MAVTQKLIEAYQQTCMAQMQHIKDIDPARFSQFNLMALLQFAAAVGVDLGMPEENFVRVAQAHFQNAFRTAPRFG